MTVLDRWSPRRRDRHTDEHHLNALCWAWRTACIGSGLCSVVNTASVWVPGTVSRPLISASAADRPDGHRRQAGIRREVLDRILIVNQAARGSAPQPRSATSDDATGLAG